MALTWRCRERVLTIGERPLLMGIVNVTPDSFSDGGMYREPSAAVNHALRLVAEGAEIVDIGGESTRPGAVDVDAGEELARVLPVVEGVARRCGAAISIDTSKAEVAARAIEAGAVIVNDVSACTADARMADVVRRSGAGVVLMHMRGTPRTMQAAPRYDDVVDEVCSYLACRMAELEAAGVAREAIVVDPGIGFGKSLDHNLALLRSLRHIGECGRPVAVGVSRKSFLGALTGRGAGERLAASLAALCACAAGGAHVLRVHDVRESADALSVLTGLRAGGGGESRWT